MSDQDWQDLLDTELDPVDMWPEDFEATVTSARFTRYGLDLDLENIQPLIRVSCLTCGRISHLSSLDPNVTHYFCSTNCQEDYENEQR